MPVSYDQKISFGSDRHKAILQAIINRRDYSKGKMDDHIDRWEQVDENLVGYIPKSQADTIREDRRRYQGKMDYITLEVPYHYAIVSAMHTYISSVFLARAPIFQFTGRHGESQDAIMAVEAVMDYQLRVGNMLPYLYHWFWDAVKYGVGFVGEYWDEEQKRVSQIKEEEVTLLGIGTGKTKRVRREIVIPGYQGNRLYNIRPYDAFPDPRVPLYDFQRGEFFGRGVPVGMSQIRELASRGYYFNVGVLERTKGKKNEIDELESNPPTDMEPGSSWVDSPYGYGTVDSSAPGAQFVNLLEMYIKIIPAAWGLGPSERTETWAFTVANERVIIGARPLGLYHNRFPFGILETGFGSEEFIKQNTVDRIRPLADTMSWLFNTHMYNVRKAINTTRVVDPSKVVMKDLQKQEPGGIIRLKPEFYGGDVRTAIMQLESVDVTRGHLADTQVIEQLIQRTSGVVDNIMGLVSEGGRKTATEVRTASGFSINRIKTFAEYFSALGFGPLAARMLENTQQLMTVDRKYAIAGNTLQNAESFVQAGPDQISGSYDFVPVDGTLPVDRLAQANFWKELLVQIARVPQISMEWDIGKMISHTMMLQGERNVERFKIQVAPQGADPGATMPGQNVVPIQEALGGRRGTAGITGGAV